MIEWNSESEEIYSNGSLEKCMSFSVRISCCLFLHKECVYMYVFYPSMFCVVKVLKSVTLVMS